MQGKKDYQEKLFAHFQLSERVPEHNFYRSLKGGLYLEFLYKLTRAYYGDSGQKSIDPVFYLSTLYNNNSSSSFGILVVSINFNLSFSKSF